MYGNPYPQNTTMMNLGGVNNMQMQMGSLGILGNMGGANTNTNTFFYTGNTIGLQSKLQDTRMIPNSYTEASITITGNQIKQANISCRVMTMVCGSFFIFPLCFMCCGWWKKMVNPGYSVPLSTYQKLQALIFNPSLRSLTLVVCDSTFDQTKARLLHDMLSKSNLKGFTFTNFAPNNNFNNSEWSDFKDNMKPIKTLPMLSDIKWHTQVVL